MLLEYSVTVYDIAELNDIFCQIPTKFNLKKLFLVNTLPGTHSCFEIFSVLHNFELWVAGLILYDISLYFGKNQFMVIICLGKNYSLATSLLQLSTHPPPLCFSHTYTMVTTAGWLLMIMSGWFIRNTVHNTQQKQIHEGEWGLAKIVLQKIFLGHLSIG